MGPYKDATYRVRPCSYVVGEDPAGVTRECPQDYSTAFFWRYLLNVLDSKGVFCNLLI